MNYLAILSRNCHSTKILKGILVGSLILTLVFPMGVLQAQQAEESDNSSNPNTPAPVDNNTENAPIQFPSLPFSVEESDDAFSPTAPTDSGPDESDIAPIGDRKRNDEKKRGSQKAVGGDSGAGRNVDTTAQSLNILPQTDLSTGALAYEYGFALPPGRNGLTPSLNLAYNSNESSNDSFVGYGWKLDIPSIVRVNKHGSDQLYNHNDFTSSLSGELVQLGSTTTYISKVDNGEFLEYEFDGNSWTVYDKHGTRYLFGATSDARQDDIENSTRVYKWMLEEVRDTNNNYIKYEYFKDAGQIYPESIAYTGHGSVDGIFEVVFNRANTEMSPTMYFTDFSVKTNKSISSVEIKENNQWVRKYELVYTTGDAGFRPLLASITESGRDPVTLVEISKEPTEFTYQTRDPINWTETSNGDWELPMWYWDQGPNDPSLIQLRDVNGDAYPDVLYRGESDNPICDSADVWINDTHGGWIEADCPDEWLVPIPLSADDTAFADNGVRLFDYNGDQLVDTVYSYASTSGPFVDSSTIYRNTANATNTWVYSNDVVPVSFIFHPIGHADNATQVVEINGDGIPDIVRGHLDDDQGYPLVLEESVYIGNGAGWSEASSTEWHLPYGIIDENFDGTEVYTFAQFIDLNADGLTDFAFRHQDEDIGKIVAINNGHDWELTDTGFEDIYPTEGTGWLGSNRSDVGTRVMDINGDGITDIVKAQLTSEGLISEGIALNSLFEDSPYVSVDGEFPFAFAEYTNDTTNIGIVDINADGMDDLLFSEMDDDNQLIAVTKLLNNTPFTDLLIGIKTTEGASSTIAYKLSTKYFDGADSLLNPDLPIAVKTVNTITTNDGFDNYSTTTYAYADGFYYYDNPQDRKFGGFGMVEKMDDENNVTKTYFHQGNQTATSSGEFEDHISKIGKPYRVEQYDDNDNLFSKTINKWDRNDLGYGASFVKLAQSIETTYDGDVDHKDKAESYTYSSTTGNITEKIMWGEVTGSDNGTFSDTGSDKFTTSISYAASSTAPISLPSQETTLDQSSNKVSESKFYYDNLSQGSVNIGNLTKQEQWKSGSSYIDIEKTYNSFGLVIQEKDPRDKITTYAYDSFNLHPASTTNPVGHVTSFEFDYSAGKPKLVTDPNGHDFEIIYDGLDRILEENQPDIDDPGTLLLKVSYEYIDDEFPTSVIKTDHLDSSLSVPTYTYFDGLGRVVQERHRAENSNTYSVKDTVYNDIGLKEKESLPYFDTGTAHEPPTSDDDLWINYEYDALGRITMIENAVGLTQNEYDDWTLTVTDANGETKGLFKDARGNLIKVEEHNGTSTYSTLYEYTGLGNLKKITDALGNVRNFTYDGLGMRLSAEDIHYATDTVFGIWNYLYDDAGNLASTTDPKGQTIHYAFDDINRVISENYTDQAGTEVLYGYDTCGFKGKLCVATTSAAISSYIYDALGNINFETKKIDGNTYTTVYSYDRAGNPIHILYPDGSEVQYTYNAAGLSETVEKKEFGEGSFTDIVEDFDYSPEGKITVQENGNGTITTNTYDADELYRLSNKTTEKATTTLQDITYTYDPVGNITEIDEDGSTQAARTVVYTYDDLHRLLSASTTASATAGFKETYTYDAIGNILTKSDQGTYSYVPRDARSYNNPHAVSYIGSFGFTYDPNGNQTLAGTASSTYDYNNRMILHSTGATSTSYTYDHTGSRMKYVAPGETTRYPNRLYNTSGTSTTKHIWNGNEMISTVEKVGTSSPSTHYIHTDHLSGSNVITNASGTISEVTDYYPYGKIRLDQTTGSFNEQRKFTGHMYDDDTDMSYMGARYYDGNIGRFRSIDPAYLDTSFDLTDPQSLNSYSYVMNNPLRYRDPNGENAWDVVKGAFNSMVSNNALGAGRISPSQYNGNQAHYQIGQTIGDVISTVQGAAEIAGGSTIAGSGAVVTVGSAGALAVAGVPAAAGGALITTHGVSVAGMGAYNLAQDGKSILGPVTINSSAAEHVMDNHTPNGVNSAGKSIFNKGENISDLVQGAVGQPTRMQGNGNFKTTYDVGRNIGTNRNMQNQQTSIMNVITKVVNGVHHLVTSFSGQ